MLKVSAWLNCYVSLFVIRYVKTLLYPVVWMTQTSTSPVKWQGVHVVLVYRLCVWSLRERTVTSLKEGSTSRHSCVHRWYYEYIFINVHAIIILLDCMFYTVGRIWLFHNYLSAACLYAVQTFLLFPTIFASYLIMFSFSIIILDWLSQFNLWTDSVCQERSTWSGAEARSSTVSTCRVRYNETDSSLSELMGMYFINWLKQYWSDIITGKLRIGLIGFMFHTINNYYRYNLFPAEYFIYWCLLFSTSLCCVISRSTWDGCPQLFSSLVVEWVGISSVVCLYHIHQRWVIRTHVDIALYGQYDTKDQYLTYNSMIKASIGEDNFS